MSLRNAITSANAAPSCSLGIARATCKRLYLQSRWSSGVVLCTLRRAVGNRGPRGWLCPLFSARTPSLPVPFAVLVPATWVG